MKTTDNQLLENLFREIPLETPSDGFMETLSLRIKKDLRKQARKRKWMTVIQLAAGVIGILSTPVIFYRQTDFTFAFPKTALSFDPLIVVIGLAVLLVLIGDSLIRKYTHHSYK
ncbi:MAG: hypothetical protein LBB85_03705 [Dysgonamonadaceae bacterium]|jgi:hypothetical protein|nr:hypothetical protein [Dysgonamonadaceae bacterium]